MAVAEGGEGGAAVADAAAASRAVLQLGPGLPPGLDAVVRSLSDDQGFSDQDLIEFRLRGLLDGAEHQVVGSLGQVLASHARRDKQAPYPARPPIAGAWGREGWPRLPNRGRPLPTAVGSAARVAPLLRV